MRLQTGILSLVLTGVLCAAGWAEDQPANPEQVTPSTAEQLNEQEQAFQELLQNAVLVGTFSVDGRNGSPKPERYTINGVTKVQGDRWIVQARITYGDTDIPVPVPVKVHWAGDTPMISVTNLSIPLVGSQFTSRVLFYGDRYAGTWQHGKVGGHMWGRIEKAKETPSGNAPEPNESSDQ
ncbi:hypothetical protein Mal4_42920 [Maioricimonas rarisocia]|uniref:Uncharacterized protein n=1 Tax=Maioricimonas rarisocia TaxID=2528026 RepID=A0A517ZBU1_9PLAN|nr:hypothetical protein [Maioricimonas rarisocia]QDU39938.1 hypothetical protein Mal4_42920 [Maioricimonas rarisocia]